MELCRQRVVATDISGIYEKYDQSTAAVQEMKEAFRVRQSGADLKPPQAAVVKSHAGERCGKVGTRFR
jgi:hypothetical protein